MTATKKKPSMLEISYFSHCYVPVSSVIHFVGAKWAPEDAFGSRENSEPWTESECCCYLCMFPPAMLWLLGHVSPSRWEGSAFRDLRAEKGLPWFLQGLAAETHVRSLRGGFPICWQNRPPRQRLAHMGHLHVSSMLSKWTSKWNKRSTGFD